MCETCGCGKPDDFTIHDHNHSGHRHGPDDHHDHDGYGHHHHHDHDDHNHDRDQDHPHKKVIGLNVDILSENNRLAERNRGYFEGS
ncbi:MAG: hypothetical protein WCI71_13405, partial [Bacteroidota bacterium]